MREWKSDPKPTPAPKKNRYQQINDMKKRAFEKSKNKKVASNQIPKDESFYKSIYFDAIENDKWECEECKFKLVKYQKDDIELSYKVRFSIHHTLSKTKTSSTAHLRYELANIQILCIDCHTNITNGRISSYQRKKIESTKKYFDLI